LRSVESRLGRAHSEELLAVTLEAGVGVADVGVVGVDGAAVGEVVGLDLDPRGTPLFSLQASMHCLFIKTYFNYFAN